jgi:transporter family protein
MRAEMWAAVTAVCWGVGSLMEKKGVKLGGLSPVMGTTLRTGVSLLLLVAVSYPYWGQVKKAGATSLSLIAIGGGVISGAVGIMALYAALKDGNLAVVMAIAFCVAPVVGLLLGWLFLHERVTGLQLLGVVLCISGAALVTLYK